MRDAIFDVVQQRSAALVARDAAALGALHHPDFRFTTPRGEVRDLEAYIAGNTGGATAWHAQHLVSHELVVAGDVAVLTGVMHDEYTRAGAAGAHDMHVTFVFV